MRIASWAIKIALLLVLYLGLSAWMARSLLPSGELAPQFQLADLDGKVHSLHQYKGKRVILYFWATWCTACSVNVPILRYVQSSYRDDPVLLSVVVDGQNLAAVRAIQQNKDITYPILLGNESMIRQYRINRFPSTYFIDAKTRISSKDTGILTPIGIWWRSLWARL
jgi:peroxiredoxin